MAARAGGGGDTVGNRELDFKPRISPNAGVTEPAARTRIQIGEPRRFGLGAVAVIYSYGLLLAAPVAASVAGMTLWSASGWSLALPLAGLAISALLLPLGQGNRHVTRMVDSWFPGASASPGAYVVQLTLSPRTRDGLMALLETADDVGVLQIGVESVSFRGDSILFEALYEDMAWLRPEGVGWRGLFVYSRPVAFEVRASSRKWAFQIAERRSWSLSQSHRVMREIRAALERRLP